MEKIFNAYFSTKPGGSGLGLSTSKKIIEAHNGSIRVDSVLGKGTSFTIQLPLED
jgi:signal transduction histidine kinase